MSPTSIAALGAIAGVTIFIGLPVGRVRNAAPRTRALLADCMGPLQPHDVGKKVYLLDDNYVQVENDEQRDARLKT